MNQYDPAKVLMKAIRSKQGQPVVHGHASQGLLKVLSRELLLKALNRQQCLMWDSVTQGS